MQVSAQMIQEGHYATGLTLGLVLSTTLLAGRLEQSDLAPFLSSCLSLERDSSNLELLAKLLKILEFNDDQSDALRNTSLKIMNAAIIQALRTKCSTETISTGGLRLNPCFNQTVIDIADALLYDCLSFEPNLPFELLANSIQPMSHNLISKALIRLSSKGKTFHSIATMLSQITTSAYRQTEHTSIEAVAEPNPLECPYDIKMVIDGNYTGLFEEILRGPLAIEQIKIGQLSLVDYVLLQDRTKLHKILLKTIESLAHRKTIIDNSNGLIICVYKSDEENLQHLLQLGADPYKRADINDDLPSLLRHAPYQALEFAILRQNQKAIRVLINHPSLGKAIDIQSSKALEFALIMKQDYLIETLLKKGFNLNSNVPIVIDHTQWDILYDVLFKHDQTHNANSYIKLKEQGRHFPYNKLIFPAHGLLDGLLLFGHYKKAALEVLTQAKQFGYSDTLLENAHLYYICTHGQLTYMLKKLYKLGLNSDKPYLMAPETEFLTAYELACKNGQLEIAEILQSLHKGAQADSSLHSSLYQAVLQHDWLRVTRLLTQGHTVLAYQVQEVRLAISPHIDPKHLILFDRLHNLKSGPVSTPPMQMDELQTFISTISYHPLTGRPLAYWMILFNQMSLLIDYYDLPILGHDYPRIDSMLMECNYLINIFDKDEHRSAFMKQVRGKQNSLLVKLHREFNKAVPLHNKKMMFKFDHWRDTVQTNLQQLYPSLNTALFQESITRAEQVYLSKYIVYLKGWLQHVYKLTLGSVFLESDTATLKNLFSNQYPFDEEQALYADQFERYITECKTYFSTHPENTFADQNVQNMVQTALMTLLQECEFGITETKIESLRESLCSVSIETQLPASTIGLHILELYGKAITRELNAQNKIMSKSPVFKDSLSALLRDINKTYSLTPSDEFQAQSLSLCFKRESQNLTEFMRAISDLYTGHSLNTIDLKHKIMQQINKGQWFTSKRKLCEIVDSFMNDISSSLVKSSMWNSTLHFMVVNRASKRLAAHFVHDNEELNDFVEQHLALHTLQLPRPRITSVIYAGPQHLKPDLGHNTALTPRPLAWQDDYGSQAKRQKCK